VGTLNKLRDEEPRRKRKTIEGGPPLVTNHECRLQPQSQKGKESGTKEGEGGRDIGRGTKHTKKKEKKENAGGRRDVGKLVTACTRNRQGGATAGGNGRGEKDGEGGRGG